MTEKDIIALLGKKRRYETEIAIMRDCSDYLLDSEQSQRGGDYALLKRRLSMIGHWLDFLSAEERYIVGLRLIKNKPWPYIAEHIRRNSVVDIPCDERTVQRQFEKAIGKVQSFMQERFGERLDYLIERQQSI